jgi:DNA-binding beta-propeller fold protein YncE
VLAAAERELAEEPVLVIGVHSPKFPTEGDPELVRQAVRRHGVTHPVVVDTEYRIWDEYAVRAWPTLVFVRPDGTIFGSASGEPDREPLVAVLRGLLEEQPELLVRDPLPLRPDPQPPGVLAYPGGLAVAGEELFVADTDHHQVVVCGPDGTERRRVGSGAPGLLDGPSDQARLSRPHGLAVAGGVLVIADTGNHAVRRLELATGEVTTLAGTGRRGRGAGSSGKARSTDLRSPWDVALHPSGAVLVAMAGSHQLWAVDDDLAGVYAGSGREARVDGDYATAAFAQPSGLAWGPEGSLYVADSEISAVRRVGGGRVETVAGGDLFDFGDVDGVGDGVRLQHPVGIAAMDGLLLVADTLNHKIKTLDPETGAVRTLLGDGTALDAALAELERRPSLPGDARNAPFCREPEAVAWDGSRVLVADTDNHRVLAVDPETGRAGVLLGG